MPLSLPGASKFTQVKRRSNIDFPSKRVLYANGESYNYGGPIEVNNIDTIAYDLDNVSPRVNGVIKRRENGFARSRVKSRGWVVKRTTTWDLGPSPAPYTIKREELYDPLDLNSAFFDSVAEQELLDDTLDNARVRLDEVIANANANVSVLFAERVKTIKMVAGRVISFGHAIVDAKNRLRKLERNPQWTKKLAHYKGHRISQVGKYWLEFWFGWYPIIKDIERALIHKPTKERYPAYGVRLSTLTGSSFNVHGVLVETKTIFRVKLKADVTVVDPGARLMAELGLANPLSTIWELISFSWLVDYFFNIGTVLASYDAQIGVELSNTSSTVSRERSATVKGGQVVFNSSSTSVTQVVHEGTYHTFHKSRSSVLPEIVPLSLRMGPGDRQWLHILALLASRLKRFI